MAQTFTSQVLSDTKKSMVIKFTATLDGTGESANVKIMGRNLPGALATDSNNAVLVSAGGAPRANYHYDISRIIGNVNLPSGYLQLNWDGTTPSPIGVFSGYVDLNLTEKGLGSIKNNAIGPNGNVSVTTVGPTSNGSYTLLFELHKTAYPAANCDFDQGQIGSPAAFNFGAYGPKP